jgi:hypothetical protein
LSIDDIANYCQIKGCRVHLGSPDSGFITIDGQGVLSRLNNYRRFLALNELASLPNSRKVLETATRYTIESETGNRLLERAEFESELERFSELIGA